MFCNVENVEEKISTKNIMEETANQFFYFFEWPAIHDQKHPHSVFLEWLDILETNEERIQWTLMGTKKEEIASASHTMSGEKAKKQLIFLFLEHFWEMVLSKDEEGIQW